jgi:hypothetical protein
MLSHPISARHPEGVSLNRLAIHPLSKIFQEKGLPGL